MESHIHVACSVVSSSLWLPWTVAHQAPLSTGFSRQEYWSRSPAPSNPQKILILSLSDISNILGSSVEQRWLTAPGPNEWSLPQILVISISHLPRFSDGSLVHSFIYSFNKYLLNWVGVVLTIAQTMNKRKSDENITRDLIIWGAGQFLWESGI